MSIFTLKLTCAFLACLVAANGMLTKDAGTNQSTSFLESILTGPSKSRSDFMEKALNQLFEETLLRMEMEKKLHRVEKTLAELKTNMVDFNFTVMNLTSTMIITQKGPRDCYDLYTTGNRKSGVYTVYPWSTNKHSVSVYCEMDLVPGGWTVFQRRGIDKLVLFNRTWLEYKNGFGNITTDFWLGNEVIHQLTTIGSNKLYFQLKDTSMTSFHAQFERFLIGPEIDQYRLHVAGQFSGNITNDYVTKGAFSLNEQPFATVDKPDTHKCAIRLAGGWWFHGCEYVYLNGPFNSIFWVWKGAVDKYRSLEYTAMMMTRA